MSVTMKREDELRKTVAMFGNQGGLLVAVLLELSPAGHRVSAVLWI